MKNNKINNNNVKNVTNNREKNKSYFYENCLKKTSCQRR